MKYTTPGCSQSLPTSSKSIHCLVAIADSKYFEEDPDFLAMVPMNTLMCMKTGTDYQVSRSGPVVANVVIGERIAAFRIQGSQPL